MSKVFVTDMDDVLVDLFSAWVKHLNTKYNLAVRLEDVTDWEISKAFPTLCPRELYDPLFTAELWSQVKPKHDAVQGLKRLIDKGYDVYVATASHHKSLPIKVELALFPYFNYLDYKNIIMCHNKQLIECDYIVDDNIDNLKGHRAITFLMDAPYNRDVDESLYDFRVHNFQQVIEIIRKIEVLESE